MDYATCTTLQSLRANSDYITGLVFVSSLVQPKGTKPVQDMADPLVASLATKAGMAAIPHGMGAVTMIIPLMCNAVSQLLHKGNPEYAAHMLDIYSAVTATGFTNFTAAHIVLPSNL